MREMPSLWLFPQGIIPLRDLYFLNPPAPPGHAALAFCDEKGRGYRR